MYTPKDKIKGGKSSGVPNDKFNKQQLRAGEKVELEHTPKKTIAREIARDHLTEIKDYYTRLRKMEEKAPKRKDITEKTAAEEDRKEIRRRTIDRLILTYLWNNREIHEDQLSSLASRVGSKIPTHKIENFLYNVLRRIVTRR